LVYSDDDFYKRGPDRSLAHAKMHKFDEVSFDELGFAVVSFGEML
jgi:hypothetical protein